MQPFLNNLYFEMFQNIVYLVLSNFVHLLYIYNIFSRRTKFHAA